MADVQWFIQVGDGKKAGPVSFEKLQQLAEKKKFFPTTKIRSTEEGAVWVAAETVPGLFNTENAESEAAENPLPSIFGTAASTTDDSAVADSETPAAIVVEPASEPAEQPESGSAAVSINIGDGSSSAATVKVSPFAINPKGSGAAKKGFVDIKGKGKKEPQPSEKSTPPTEKKAGGGFFGFAGGTAKKKDESSVVANKPTEKDASTPAKKSTGGSSDGSTTRKIMIGAPASEKSTGFPKISIGAKESKPEVEPAAVSTEPTAESSEEQTAEAVPSFFADVESAPADLKAPVDETPETVATAEETMGKSALSGRSKSGEPSNQTVPVAVQGGSSVPVWLLVAMIVVLSLALIVNGVLVYLAAAKIENAVAGLEKTSATKTVKTVKETPKVPPGDE